MTEGELPDLHRIRERREKLVSKKRWDEITAEYVELLKEGPAMSPEEAFRRIKQVDMTINPYVSREKRDRYRVVRALEEEILKREGLDPKEWVKFTDTQPKAGWDTPFTDEDMERIGERLPEGLELFVLPGSVSSGSEHLPANYSTMEHFWSVFVRLKPPETSTSLPSLEPPKEN